MSDYVDLSQFRSGGFPDPPRWSQQERAEAAQPGPAAEPPAVDLLSEMSRPTEQVAEEQDDDENLNPDDFEDDDDPEPGEQEPVQDKSFWREQARMWISAFDTLQRSALANYVYPKAILEPTDRQKLARFKNRTKGRRKDDIVYDDDIQSVLDRYAELEENIGKLPFSSGEKETLTAPLANLLEKHQSGQLSPEVALIIAVAIVMIPRLAPGLPLVLGKQK